MLDTNSPINLSNIQGNILGGFNKDFQTFIFVNFPGDRQAQDWLRDIVDEIATSEEVLAFNALFKAVRKRRSSRRSIWKATWMNVAFTQSGLAALGVPQHDLDNLPVAFRDGMRNRASVLGDVGDSDPSKWVEPFASTYDDIHALILVASDTPEDLNAEIDWQCQKLAAHQIKVLDPPLEGQARQDQPGHEHFGFKDGISQPSILGVTTQSIRRNLAPPYDPAEDPIPAGEFVLSYPTVPRPPRPAAGEEVNDPARPVWTDDGSYLVFRRIRQNVKAFRDFVAEQAALYGMSEDLMAAKVVGRYQSGAPLEPFPSQLPAPEPILGDPSNTDDDRINKFGYANDRDGRVVPRGAHIRKAFPRDQVAGTDADDQESRRHRLLRRGIPFGESFDPEAPVDHRNGAGPEFPDDRGLFFLCYQSSIENQFEHVLTQWVNNSSFPFPNDGVDPLISPALTPAPDVVGHAVDAAPSPTTCPFFRLPGGRRQEPQSIYPDPSPTIPPDQQDRIPLQQWITTTGGVYLFQPSLSALREHLASANY